MPKIICSFNLNYENFLKELYAHIINEYGYDLKLSELHEIEIVKFLTNDSDGRMIDEHTIHISARLYNQLPVLDIKRLHGDSIFDLIIGTLYHELCHIGEIFTMPSLHQYAFAQDGVDYMIALFWIEYIVGAKANKEIIRDKSVFCTNVAKRAWNIKKLNFEDSDCSNFFYLTKVAPYVISYMRIIDSMDAYLETVKNPIVNSLFFELNNEVSRLESLYPFDDINLLRGIENIFSNHWDHFMKRKVFTHTAKCKGIGDY